MYSISFTLLFGAILFLAACTKSGENVSTVTDTPLAVEVRQNPNNQSAIKITGRATGARAEEADQLLMETDGYVSARDRLLQMDLLRRLGKARLGELFPNDSAVEKDKFSIAVGLPWAIENSTARIQKNFPKEYALLEAYSRGVNKFIAEVPTKFPHVLRQFQLLSGSPRFVINQWEPKDSIAVATNITFYLSSAIMKKIDTGIIALIERAVGRETELATLFDFRPIENRFIVPKPGVQTSVLKPLAKTRVAKAKSHGALAKAAPTFDYVCKDYGFPMPECQRLSSVGSNNWVVSKAYAGGDASLLANDPHLPMTFPSTFMEISLDSKTAGGTIRVRGVRPPGVPGVLIGHNDEIAWGMTNVTADVDNIYIEELNVARTQYRWGRNFKDLKKITFPLHKRRLDGTVDTSESITLRYTDEHGPLFSEHIDELNKNIRVLEGLKIYGTSLAASYKWGGHRGTPEYIALLGMNRAQNIGEFRRALDFFEVGAQNIVYADRKGNIGYTAHGKYPLRPYLNDTFHPFEFITSPAREGIWEWSGERAQIPEVVKTDGFIVTANNDPFGGSAKMTAGNYEDYFAYDFTDGIRAERISQLIEQTKAQKGSLTIADMQAIQLDKKDLLAERVITLVEKSGVREKLTPKAQGVVDAFTKWKAAGTWAHADRMEPVVFYEWLPLLMSEILGFKAVEDPPFDPATMLLLSVAYDKAVTDLQVSSTAVKTLYHKLNDRLAMASGPERDEALKWLTTSLEKTPGSLTLNEKDGQRWGQVNRLVFADLLGGLVPEFFSYPIERGGAFETVDPAFPGKGYGANFRIIYEVREGAPIKARFATPGGNYSPLQPKEAIREILLWRDGGMRDLVPFAE